MGEMSQMDRKDMATETTGFMAKLRNVARTAGVTLLVMVLVYSFIRHGNYRGMGAQVLQPGTVVAPFALTNIQDGSTVDISKLGGKPIILTFWGPFCRSCMNELPHIQALSKRYGDRVAFLTVADGEPRAIQGVIERFGLSVPVLLDTEGSVYGQFDVFTIPYNVVIGGDLRVITDYVGAANGERIEMWLERLLHEHH
jgi:peroxiredoxin